jgi:Holliday junction resolvasome RuvABC ATP-dependent DNA helicase subunit
MKLLPNVIGQEVAKRELSLRFDTFEKTGYFPNMFIGGNAGDGKTYITKEIARHLHNLTKKADRVCPKENAAQRPLVKVNCSSIKNQKEFFENFIMQKVEGRQCMVHLDECHDLNAKVRDALLTILEPTPERRTSYAYFDYHFDFDFTVQNFIFTTTEEQKVFPPLMKRLRRIDLAEYSPKELAEIVKLGCPDVHFKEDALDKLVVLIRQEGRAAHLIGDEIREFAEVKGKKEINPKDVENMKSALNLLPFGITAAELNLMRVAQSYPESVTITTLSNRVNKGVNTVRAMERYLVRVGMWIVDGERSLTKLGREFLEAHPVAKEVTLKPVKKTVKK